MIEPENSPPEIIPSDQSEPPSVPRRKRPYVAPVLTCESQAAPETPKMNDTTEFPVSPSYSAGHVS
jgi:hypothetical protein